MFAFESYSNEDQDFIRKNLNRVFAPTNIQLPSGELVWGESLNSLIEQIKRDPAKGLKKRKNEFDTSMLIEHTYMMNPETDEVVPSGFELLNGMSVLIENAGYRQVLQHINSTYGTVELYNNALVRNRWCEVTHLKIWNGEYLTFVGVYDDGVKIQRSEPVENAWLVWIDSLPDLGVEQLDESAKPKLINTGRPVEEPKKTNDTTFPENPTFFNTHIFQDPETIGTDYKPAYPAQKYGNPGFQSAAEKQYRRDEGISTDPPTPRWWAYGLDEIDDLIRWKRAHLGNAGDVETIRDDFELRLSSGSSIDGRGLRYLFGYEFSKKAAGAKRSWVEFNRAEIKKILELKKSGLKSPDDAVIPISDTKTISGEEFKHLFA